MQSRDLAKIFKQSQVTYFGFLFQGLTRKEIERGKLVSGKLLGSSYSTPGHKW